MSILERWEGYDSQSWQERFEELDKRYIKSQRSLTDAAYMQAALVPMLGPKASEVWKMWSDKNITRLHFSWGPEGAKTSGEERAQIHLDLEKACEEAVLVENVDLDMRILD